MATVLYVTAEVVRQVAILRQPFMPESAAKLLDLLAVAADERAFCRMLASRPAGRRNGAAARPTPVFPRYVEPKPEGEDGLTMLIDTHCHLDFADFDAERDEVVARARFGWRGADGDDLDAGAQVRTACWPSRRQYPTRCFARWARIRTMPHEELDITAESCANSPRIPRCVAIGEAGLDYFYDRAAQPAGAGLPHANRRGASDRPAAGHPCARRRRGHGRDPGGGDAGRAVPVHPALLRLGRGARPDRGRLGGYISFSGILTFQKSRRAARDRQRVPRERLLVETDAPYLAPKRYRGKRNEPAYVVKTAEVLAETSACRRQRSPRMTTENAFRLFSKMPARRAAGA